MNNFLKKILNCAAAIVFFCVIYNSYLSFFPDQTALGHDEAEHLHVAYLISIGQRPFVDFIENHPTLFHHLINRIDTLFHPPTTPSWISFTRLIVFIHFLISIGTLLVFLTNELRQKKPLSLWCLILITALSITGISNKDLILMWQIRPDWICYAYSLISLTLFAKIIDKNEFLSLRSKLTILISGLLLGFANALIPKSLPLAFSVMSYLALKISQRNNLELKKYFFPFSIYLLSAFASALFFVFYDCYLSKISFKLWWNAVILYNSTPHPPLISRIQNPVNVLITVFQWNLVRSFLFIFLLSYFISENHKEKNLVNNKVFFISFFTAIWTFLQPALTNGLGWSHYYIPLLFVAVALNTLFIITIIDKYQSTQRPRFWVFIILLAAISYIHPLALNISNALESFYTKNINPLKNGDFVEGNNIDTLLPTDAIYLTFSPTRMPVKARHWGPYYMLATDKNAWCEYSKLIYLKEFGPDWARLFEVSPPDIITISGIAELQSVIWTLSQQQNYNASWLLNKIKTNYILLEKNDIIVYVNKSYSPVMLCNNWSIKNDLE